MPDLPPPPNYTYRAHWDPEYREYNARCLEFHSVVARASTAHRAVEAAELLVRDELADRAEYALPAPDSISDHRYSGRFLVRTSPAMHANLMIEAREQGVPFNLWVACELGGRQPPSIEDLWR